MSIHEVHANIAAQFNDSIQERFGFAHEQYNKLQAFLNQEQVKPGYVLATRRGYVYVGEGIVTTQGFVGCKVWETREEATDYMQAWNSIQKDFPATVLTHSQGYQREVRELVSSVNTALFLIVK